MMEYACNVRSGTILMQKVNANKLVTSAKISTIQVLAHHAIPVLLPYTVAVFRFQNQHND